MKSLKNNIDYLLAAVIVAGFFYVAAQRLGEAPLPDSDESMTLQVPYEMLYRGKLAFPMYSFLGGNIENSWHSYTPVFFVALSGFMKAFGWGLLQGRVFNLIAAALLLLIVYLIARRLVGWQAGLISLLMLVSDPVFLARSRLVRNDILAAAFGLLAFYLYEWAEARQARWYYVASGLAAGAGVMCHTNLLYMLCVIGTLMLLRRGWGILRTAKPYLFAGGALAVMAYEIVYALIDYQNFILQNRQDDVHFRVLEPLGWLRNLMAERVRYTQWFNADGARIAPQTDLLHNFLFLTLVAIVYLAARSLIHFRRGNAIGEERVRVLVATVVVSLFFALVTQRKVTQYVVHLAPWFALCVGILIQDGWSLLRRLRDLRWRWSKIAYRAAILSVALAACAYGYKLIAQTQNYLTEVRNQDQSTFEEFKTALRSVVPEGVCPVSIASAHLWLVFPEHDQCYFAYMEARLDQRLDLNGKEYALIVKPKFEERLRKLTGAGFETYHFLGELRKTAYGTFNVYYTGTNQRYKTLAPKIYHFSGRQSGYEGDDQ